MNTSNAATHWNLFRHQKFTNAVELKIVDASGFAWNVREKLSSHESTSQNVERLLLEMKETSGGPFSLLCKNLRRVRHVSLLLEEFPSHDTDIDDKTHTALSEYGEFTIFLNMSPLKTCLQNSLEQIQLAQESISGILRGDEKDKMEASLARHCRQTEALIALSNELSMRHKVLPKKPFQIRRVMMVNLLLACRTVITLMEKTLKEEHAREIDAQILLDFESQIPRVRKVRATLAKLRDNPSQKISTTINDCINRSDDIVRALEQLVVRANEIDVEARAQYTIHCKVQDRN